MKFSLGGTADLDSGVDVVVGGGGAGGGPEVKIVVTSGKARSDLRQISAETSGVHPVVTPH